MNLHGNQYAVFTWTPETAGLPGPAATSFTSLLPNIVAGYSDAPGYTINENQAPLLGLAEYDKAQFIKGRREAVLQNTLFLGNANLLRYGLRSSNLNSVPGELQPIAVGAGVQGEGSHFMVGRHALMREFNLSFGGIGTPVPARFEFWPTFTDFSLGPPTFSDTAIGIIGGEVLTWADCQLTINGANHRALVNTASVTVTNDLVRVGMRRDNGDNNDLSRTPQLVYARATNIALEFSLFDRLPSSLRNSALNSTTWANVVFRATKANEGFVLTINEAVLESHSQGTGSVGEMMKFSANAPGRNATLAII